MYHGDDVTGTAILAMGQGPAILRKSIVFLYLYTSWLGMAA